MTEPAKTIEAFLAMWGDSPSGVCDSIRAYFTPTTYWENVGLAVTTGIDEAVALCELFERDVPPFRVEVDIVTLAVDGNMVFSERVDRFINADGTQRMAVPCMGAYEVRDGKIMLWRDYFDPAAMAGLSGEGATTSPPASQMASDREAAADGGGIDPSP